LRSLFICALVLGTAGCSKGVLDLGLGAETDARFTSDVYTWECASEDAEWMGTFGFNLSLTYTPDNLATRELPPLNACDSSLSMFSMDTLEGGTDIPDVDSPKWSTQGDSGRMDREVEGLYYDDVFRNVFSCDRAEAVIAGGVLLEQAGRLSGVRTPAAGEVISVSSDSEAVGGLSFGESITLNWEADGWDESFIQIRRTRSEQVVETLTCNTTGLSEFEIDSSIWGELNEAVNADTNYLYVGFRNTGNERSPDGQKVDIETRALHVVGITDI